MANTPETSSSIDIPRESPWAILVAYLASRGEEKKIVEIKKYLELKRERDQLLEKELTNT